MPENTVEQPCPNCSSIEECDCMECEGCDTRTDGICGNCSQCSDCCQCVVCDHRHGHRVERVCENCSRCEQHCECRYCENCDRSVDSDDVCSRCNSCASCCSCGVESEEPNVRFFTSRPCFHKGKLCKENPSRRFVSAEIEVERAEPGEAIYNSVKKWKGSIVSDGSLPDSGFEINTAPAQGAAFAEQIGEIGEALNAQKATVSTSCGYHVHVDARDFTYWDLRRLIKVYAKIEKALFWIVPQSRRRSAFCQKCGEEYTSFLSKGQGAHTSKELKKEILMGVYGRTDTREYRRDAKPSARYRALNIHSWIYRGTIECRLAAGTTDPVKIINWGILWAGILDYAYKTTEKMIDMLPEGHSWQCLLAVCPTDTIRKWVEERRTKFGE